MKNGIIALLFCFSIPALAQQFIYVKKGNEFPEVRFGLKERVTFLTDPNLPWSSGMIQEIGDDYIVINQATYPLKSIIAFRTKNELLSIGGNALWIGGVFFTGIVVFNKLINPGDPPIKTSQFIWGGGLVLVGLGMLALSKKEYYVSDGYKWVTIDLNKPVQK